MTLETIIIYITLGGLGLIFQAILRGEIRIIIYPLSFILGLITGIHFNYYTLSFNVGMISRAAISGYWICALVETAALVAGFLVGFYVF